MNNCQIIQGDCLCVLKTLPDESVDCCVTSPPYWGLRDYGVEGQIGLEKTPLDYIATMVHVFSEVHRVLKNEGTCWINIGDSYARSAGDDSKKQTDQNFRTGRTGKSKELFKTGNNRPPTGLKPKNLIGIPWRVAFALQDFGWYLRSDIIWAKPNCMPESVTDRPTRSHEYIFLLSKSSKYFYDAEAIKERCSENTHARLAQDVQNQIGSARANGGAKTNGNMKAVCRKSDGKNGRVKDNESFDSALPIMPEYRNKRSVWTVPPVGYKDAHFATYPPDLIKPCILAGSPIGGTVLDPFGGSGTTGQVAIELGRNAILIELNPKYVELIKDRTNITSGLPL